MAVKNEPADPVQAREIVSSRLFNTPRERVFKAWTDPERLAWWGPRLHEYV